MALQEGDQSAHQPGRPGGTPGDVNSPTGLVVRVRNGVLGYRQSWGLRDRELAVPVGDDTIWRLYSMTKPVTGTAAALLIE